MLRIHVLVAATSKDIAAELISAAVARSTGMVLLRDGPVATSEVDELLAEVPPSAACALVLVGPRSGSRLVATRSLRRRRRLAVVQVDVATDIVQITARDVGMEPLLAALRDLLDRVAPWATLLYGTKDPGALPMKDVRTHAASELPGVRDFAYAGARVAPRASPTLLDPTRPAYRRAVRNQN